MNPPQLSGNAGPTNCSHRTNEETEESSFPVFVADPNCVNATVPHAPSAASKDANLLASVVAGEQGRQLLEQRRQLLLSSRLGQLSQRGVKRDQLSNKQVGDNSVNTNERSSVFCAAGQLLKPLKIPAAPNHYARYSVASKNVKRQNIPNLGQLSNWNFSSIGMSSLLRERIIRRDENVGSNYTHIDRVLANVSHFGLQSNIFATSMLNMPNALSLSAAPFRRSSVASMNNACQLSTQPPDLKKQIQSLPTTLSKSKGRPPLFPQKLHRMLLDLEKQPGGTDIASFLPHGLAFTIHRCEEFVENVIPRYFAMKSITSFQRQLKMYEFERITAGSDAGAFFHKYFVREHPELCKEIKRVDQRKQKVTPQANT